MKENIDNIKQQDVRSKVSIIIPAFNTRDVISETLESIRNQTYSDYEIIIVNDGSTDELKEFLNNYTKNNKNIIVFNQKNTGVSAARNKGVSLSTGNFICFLDSDDIYDHHFLEEMVLKLSNSTADLVCCESKNSTKDDIIKVNLDNINNLRINDYLTLLSNGLFPHLSSFLIKKEFLMKNSIYFDPEQKYAEDILFLTQLLLRSKDCKVVNSSLFTYQYRHNSAINSLTTIKKINEVDGLIKVKNLLMKNEAVDKKLIDDFNNSITKKILNIKYEFLISCNYKNLKIINSNKTYNCSELNLNKSSKKLMKATNDASYFKYFIGTLYYKYIRKSKI